MGPLWARFWYGLDLGEGGLLALRRADPALALHGGQDEARALLGVGLLLVAEGRVVERRAADHRGEERALGHRELRDVLAEVRLRGRLDAVRAAAVVDRVEVVLEDLVLGLLLVDLQRDEDLARLARQRAVLGEEVVLHVLLGDRRPTLRRLPALDGDPHGARDARGRDAVVAVEVLVLGREHRLLHRVGHLGQRHRLAVAVGVGEAGHLGLAVGVVDDGGLGRRDLVRLGDVGHRVGDPDPDDTEDEEHPGRPQRAHGPLPPGGAGRRTPRRTAAGRSGGPGGACGGGGSRGLCGLGLGAGTGLAGAHATPGTGIGDGPDRVHRTWSPTASMTGLLGET